MSQGITINELRVGSKARIIGFGSEDIPVKLYEMGLLPGARLTKKQQLPRRGPIRLQLDQNPHCIALRASEAELIMVQPE